MHLSYMPCELCELEKKTPWYYEDDEFVVLECDTCKIPMVVVREHTQYPDEELISEIEEKVGELFDDFEFRKNQRKIKDHWHWHIVE